MQTLLRALGSALLATALVGCGLVYKPDVQQGNLLDKKNVAELKSGMTKRQVLVLLGSPSVSSPFEQNRWDYVSTLQKRGRQLQARTLTLYFENDALVRTEGDFFPEDSKELLQESKKYKDQYPDEKRKEQKPGAGASGGTNPPGQG